MGADMFLGRCAPHHRHGPDAVARRPDAGQSRSAVGDVADRRGARGGRADAGRRRSRRSSAATASWSSGWWRSAQRSLRSSKRRAYGSSGVGGLGGPGSARCDRLDQVPALQDALPGRCWPRRGCCAGPVVRDRPAAAADRGRIGIAAPTTSRSRPTRNARRSFSLRSSTRMMCGVSVRMTSVCSRLVLRVREEAADDRDVDSAREPLDQASAPRRESGRPACWFRRHCSRMTVLTVAVGERRQAAEPFARDAAHLDLQRQRHLVVVVQCAA